MVNDIFGFFNDICKMKSIFVFSDLMVAENGKVVYSVGKVFLMIKNGPGFMVSQMHSLFIKWQTMEHTGGAMLRSGGAAAPPAQNKFKCFGPQPHLWLSSTRCKNDIMIVMQCKQEINMQ